MKQRILRGILVIPAVAGASRSLPAQVGTSVPSYPVRPPNPREHAKDMTTSVEIGPKPLEPANDSILAI